MRAKVKAFAKINLTLNICGVQGGYHDIESLVTTIDLFDTVTVSPRKDDKIILNLDFDDKKGTLVIYAYIGEVPLANREAIYTQALEDNFFWNGTEGATLGLDKQSQSLMLELHMKKIMNV